MEVGENRNPSAAWTYRHPYPWIREIKNRVAFWSGVEIVPNDRAGPGSGQATPDAVIVKLETASPRTRLGMLVALLAGGSIWLLVAGAPSSRDLPARCRSGRWLGPVTFVAIYIGWTVALLPAVVPTLAGGALFGVAVGSLLTLIGAVTESFLAGDRSKRLT